MRGQVILKSEVGIRPDAEAMSIDPDLSIHGDTVKFDENLLILGSFRQVETLAIPSKPAGQVTSGCSGGSVGIKGPLDAPVVRKVELPPLRVIKSSLLGPLGIPLQEEPVGIEILAVTGPGQRSQE